MLIAIFSIGWSWYLSLHRGKTGGFGRSVCTLRHGSFSQICHFYTANLLKNDLKPPYNFDEYCKPFFPVGDRLEQQAKEAEEAGDKDKARELWLRAACVWRTARQPCPMAPNQHIAWSRQKVAFYNGSRYAIINHNSVNEH
jgi:hypothetical protein